MFRFLGWVFWLGFFGANPDMDADGKTSVGFAVSLEDWLTGRGDAAPRLID